MALPDFLTRMGYGRTAPGLSRGRNADYFGLHGDERYAAFLLDQEQNGALAPSSVNNQARQLVEGGVASEQFRQENLARSLAAAGVNPAIASRIIEQDKSQALNQISSQMAGFEGQRQEREFAAGQDFVQFSSAQEAEVTARAEDQRRFRIQQREARKARNLAFFTSVLGAAATVASGGLAGAGGFAALLGQKGSQEGGAEGQTGYSGQNQHGGGEAVQPQGFNEGGGGGGGGQPYPSGPSFGQLYGQGPATPNGLPQYQSAFQGQPPQTQYPFGQMQGTAFGNMYPSWMYGPKQRAWGT